MPTGSGYVLLNDIHIGLSLHVAHSLMEESVNKAREHNTHNFKFPSYKGKEHVLGVKIGNISLVWSGLIKDLTREKVAVKRARGRTFQAQITTCAKALS